MNYARKPTISNPVIIVICSAHSQLFHKEAASVPAVCCTDVHWQVSKARELKKEKDYLDQRIQNNSATRKLLLHRAVSLDYKN